MIEMIGTMTRMTALSLLAAIPLALGAPTTAVAQEGGPAADLETMPEQVEIMRLVLVRSINNRLADLLETRIPEGDSDEQSAAKSTRENLVSGSYESFVAVGRGSNGPWKRPSRFTSHTRGFYAAGIGMIFDTEVQSAVVHVSAEEAPDPKETNEWDAAEAEVRTGSSSRTATLYGAVTSSNRRVQSSDGGMAMIDPEFVDTAIEAIIHVLGKHGQKLKALPNNEDVIVGLRMTPDSSLSFGVEKTKSGEFTDAIATLRAQYQFFGASALGPQTVVVRIPKSAIPTLDRGGDVDIAAIKQKATITSYTSSGSKKVTYSGRGTR
jgi:hypothetical protein